MLAGAFAAMLESKGQGHLNERLFPADMNLSPKPNRGRLPPHLRNPVSSSSSSLSSSSSSPTVSMSSSSSSSTSSSFANSTRNLRSLAVVSPDPELDSGSQFPDDDVSLLEPLLPSPFAPAPVPALPVAEETDPKPDLRDFSSVAAYTRALNAFEKRKTERGTKRAAAPPATEPSDDDATTAATRTTAGKAARTLDPTPSSASSIDSDFARACAASRIEGLLEQVRRAERVERERRELLEEVNLLAAQSIPAAASAASPPLVLLSTPTITAASSSSSSSSSAMASASASATSASASASASANSASSIASFSGSGLMSSSASVCSSTPTSSSDSGTSTSTSTSAPRPEPRLAASCSVPTSAPHPPVRPHPMQRLANLLQREGVPHSPLAQAP